jgi:hypothetical protein
MRELRAIFENNPGKTFATDALLVLVYNDGLVTQNRRDVINAGMKKIGPPLGVLVFRIRGENMRGGWQFIYRLKI